jgi:hypothetical protein
VDEETETGNPYWYRDDNREEEEAAASSVLNALPFTVDRDQLLSLLRYLLLDRFASALFRVGCKSIEDVAFMTEEDLMRIGMTTADRKKLRDGIKEYHDPHNINPHSPQPHSAIIRRPGYRSMRYLKPTQSSNRRGREIAIARNVQRDLREIGRQDAQRAAAIERPSFAST